MCLVPFVCTCNWFGPPWFPAEEGGWGGHPGAADGPAPPGVTEQAEQTEQRRLQS